VSTGKMLLGKILISAAVVLTLAVTLLVDWTVGHMADPMWHPHAHYHLLLYHGTMAMFCVAALWCLWGPWRAEPFALLSAVFVVLAFALPFYPAALFPSASIYATREMAAKGVPANLIVMGALAILALVGYYLACPRPSPGGRR
jgi:hypothetical protein